MLTAGLLYLGAGSGLLVFEISCRQWFKSGVEEAPVRWSDARLLAGVILTGGMLGPFLMLYGLDRLSGVLTSLLLNLEAPFTVLVAVLIFREHLVRRELAGIVTIVVAAGILTYRPDAIQGDAVGILAEHDEGVTHEGHLAGAIDREADVVRRVELQSQRPRAARC